MFVPDALCHTVVPDTFKVLLSQRRRWINSTVHNLLELVRVHNLCGVGSGGLVCGVQSSQCKLTRYCCLCLVCRRPSASLCVWLLKCCYFHCRLKRVAPRRL